MSVAGRSASGASLVLAGHTWPEIRESGWEDDARSQVCPTKTRAPLSPPNTPARLLATTSTTPPSSRSNASKKTPSVAFIDDHKDVRKKNKIFKIPPRIKKSVNISSTKVISKKNPAIRKDFSFARSISFASESFCALRLWWQEEMQLRVDSNVCSYWCLDLPSSQSLGHPPPFYLLWQICLV